MKKRMVMIKPWDPCKYETPVIMNDEASQELMYLAAIEYNRNNPGKLYSCIIVDGYDNKEELSKTTNIPIELLEVEMKYKGKTWYFSPASIVVSYTGDFCNVFDVPDWIQKKLEERPIQTDDLVPDTYYRE